MAPLFQPGFFNSLPDPAVIWQSYLPHSSLWLVADITAFQREPEFYAFGMFISLTMSAIWQILSSYLSFNTSSTHSISEYLYIGT